VRREANEREQPSGWRDVEACERRAAKQWIQRKRVCEMVSGMSGWKMGRRDDVPMRVWECDESTGPAERSALPPARATKD
jgi:hypothetical protein